jgi:hypothetical protein
MQAAWHTHIHAYQTLKAAALYRLIDAQKTSQQLATTPSRGADDVADELGARQQQQAHSIAAALC